VRLSDHPHSRFDTAARAIADNPVDDGAIGPCLFAVGNAVNPPRCDKENERNRHA
jgi:hypothetical protein